MGLIDTSARQQVSPSVAARVTDAVCRQGQRLLRHKQAEPHVSGPGRAEIGTGNHRHAGLINKLLGESLIITAGNRHPSEQAAMRVGQM